MQWYPSRIENVSQKALYENLRQWQAEMYGYIFGAARAGVSSAHAHVAGSPPEQSTALCGAALA